jgi:hypothetical protein
MDCACSTLDAGSEGGGGEPRSCLRGRLVARNLTCTRDKVESNDREVAGLSIQVETQSRELVLGLEMLDGQWAYVSKPGSGFFPAPVESRRRGSR